MPEPTLTSIPIGNVHPTRQNARVFLKNDPALERLASSIAQAGILQPLVGRPHPTRGKGHIDLRAGERRLKAARLAKLQKVPVLVREMSDEEAMEVTLAENLHREDLTPLEEAKGLNIYLGKGWAVAKIAAHFGETTKWVRMRAHILNLTPAWIEAYQDNQEHNVHEMNAPALAILARLPSDTQDAILDEKGYYFRADRKAPTAQDVDRLAGEYTQLLCQADWIKHRLPGRPGSTTDDPTLEPTAGPCADCIKRSACQPDLFEDDPVALGPTDRCLDARCWAAKSGALTQIKAAHLKEKHSDAVFIADGYSDDDNPLAKAARQSWEVEEVKPSEVPADERVRAMNIDGKNAGKEVWIRKGSRRGGAAVAHGPMTQKDKEAQLKKRRDLLYIKDIREDLENYARDEIGSLDIHEAATLALAFGTSHRRDSFYTTDPEFMPDPIRNRNPWDIVEDEGLAGPTGAKAIAAMLAARALDVALGRLTNPADVDKAVADADRAARYFGFNAEIARLSAIGGIGGIRTPKTWAADDPHFKAIIAWEDKVDAWLGDREDRRGRAPAPPKRQAKKARKKAGKKTASLRPPDIQRLGEELEITPEQIASNTYATTTTKES